jgi:anti-anti-sigma factor
VADAIATVSEEDVDALDDGLFELSVEVDADATRLTLQGDLDITSASLLDAKVTEIRPIRGPLFVDVSELLFVDSTGLRSLTATRRAVVEDGGGPVTLVGCRRSLSKLLEMTGLQDAFEQG